MTNGLRLRFTSEELAAHLIARAEHHEARASAKLAEIPALRETVEKLNAGKTEKPKHVAGKFSNAAYGGAADVQSAIETIEGEVREHQNRSVAFKLFSSHLFPGDYDLGEQDLARLEMIPRF